ILPQPPPPLPPLPPRPRPAPRVTPPGTLSNPMDLSFGPEAPRPRPAARGTVASRAIDLSPGPPRDGPSRSDPYAQIRARNASVDWNRALEAYWLRHRYYPRQAAEAGEDGTVVIELTVARSGRVESVQLVSRSGSQWLDMAALGTFRGGQLPPFTSEMTEDRITFTIPITYYLIRH
ncbi:MAG TPA: TonB family protein, partial [Acetobacteraceae bacterium]|nr:TonB family protein [Acetobacteraceae bacterium]